MYNTVTAKVMLCIGLTGGLMHYGIDFFSSQSQQQNNAAQIAEVQAMNDQQNQMAQEQVINQILQQEAAQQSQMPHHRHHRHHDQEIRNQEFCVTWTETGGIKDIYYCPSTSH